MICISSHFWFQQKGSRTQIIERDAPWRSRAQRMLIDALIKSQYCIHVENMHIELINVYSRTNWVNKCILCMAILGQISSMRYMIANQYAHTRSADLSPISVNRDEITTTWQDRSRTTSIDHPCCLDPYSCMLHRHGTIKKGSMTCIMLADFLLFLESYETFIDNLRIDDIIPRDYCKLMTRLKLHDHAKVCSWSTIDAYAQMRANKEESVIRCKRN